MGENKSTEIITESEVVDLPKYCFYNKFLLVEELALERNYLKLHNGRCTVIGKLHYDHNGYFVLGNINLSSILPRDYSLPEGVISLRLFKFATSNVLENGRYCEICGEVVLWSPNHTPVKWLPTTPRGVLECELQKCEKMNKIQLLELMQAKYQPAINIFQLDYIECPSELIQRHLKIRLIT
ncbi:unnamed protein product [Ceratitis capitata]|uniref:(Mediterranean fruit fly) hypothetical protein n=1 Tax=Ceratitis capitata TaxID=7213 RepID=A0A811UZ57_CERCA|nr:unnamed protein product [Ceratitis capitata]